MGNENYGGYNQSGYNQGGYNQGGYNQGGYNQGGYNQGGYNQGGYNQGGYNQGGYNQGGYNQGGYNQQGYMQNAYGNQGGGYNQGGGMPPRKPDNYLVWNILQTLFCCLILGIIGIVYSTKVDSAWNAGNYQEAINNSNMAKKMLFWGVGISLACIILYIIFIVAFGFSVAGM